MKRMKKLIIVMISFGLFVSPTIAGDIFSDADFFYGASADNQLKISIADSPQTGSGPSPDDVLKPEFFYGYKD